MDEEKSSDSNDDRAHMVGRPPSNKALKEAAEAAEKRKHMDAKYSVARFRRLLDYFRELQIMTPDTPPLLVERIRNLAEYLVYGQKINDSVYFEDFIEENVC